VADLIGANAKDIVFTSGATEANNMAIKGVARFYGRSGKKHIITTQTEHKCVLDSCRVLQDEGFDVTYLPVQKNGIIDLDVLESAIRPDTCLVSVRTLFRSFTIQTSLLTQLVNSFRSWRSTMRLA
jgi:cysteine desulfurase